jgi:hypothetical protein
MEFNMKHDLIVSEFKRIKELGFVKNVKTDSSDGSIGNTFEYHLNVKENNLTEADFDDFEVKAKDEATSSVRSLFSKKPTFPPKGDGYMLSQWGYPDPDHPTQNKLYTSIYGHRWSLVDEKYNMKLEIEDDRIYLHVTGKDTTTTLDRTVYWDFEAIKKGSKKLKNLFTVVAKREKREDGYYYHYTNATVYMDYIGNDNFISLIKEGLLRYDHRLGVTGINNKRGPGKPHNHGGGFRIDGKYLPKLYKTVIEID